MPYQSISFETEGQIAIVTLNRPQRRNALSLELMTELIHCLNEIARDRSLRAVILAACGKSFLLRPRPQRDGRPRHQRLPRGLRRLHRTDDARPVHPAAGDRAGARHRHRCWLPAGRHLRSRCRLRPGGFATPGVKIGLFCTTPMVALSRAVGRKRALQMLMTGDMVDALTAVEWGLINMAVPASELEEQTRKLAARIAEASSLTVALGKQAFYTQIDLDQPKAYAYAKEVMSMNALAADAQEGISAFLEKRQACWAGK